ncbi:hypothetical protein HDU76_007945 [Blyttiomyces sp. JEL0837]|nr:hypothetical protein HDU76_007945 [Blyttiomyces sp. JEL0837]
MDFTSGPLGNKEADGSSRSGPTFLDDQIMSGLEAILAENGILGSSPSSFSMRGHNAYSNPQYLAANPYVPYFQHQQQQQQHFSHHRSFDHQLYQPAEQPYQLSTSSRAMPSASVRPNEPTEVIDLDTLSPPRPKTNSMPSNSIIDLTDIDDSPQIKRFEQDQRGHKRKHEDSNSSSSSNSPSTFLNSFPWSNQQGSSAGTARSVEFGGNADPIPLDPLLFHAAVQHARNSPGPSAHNPYDPVVRLPHQNSPVQLNDLSRGNSWSGFGTGGSASRRPLLQNPLQHAHTVFNNVTESKVKKPALLATQSEGLLSSVNEEVIDLTGDDSEAKIKAEAASYKNEIVCYGVVHTLVVDFQKDTYAVASSSERTMKVKLLPEVAGDNIYNIKVLTPDKMKLGYVEKGTAAILSPALGKLRMEAAIPRTQFNKYSAALHLTLYGRRAFGQDLGVYLARNKVILRPITNVSSTPYENPHAVMTNIRSVSQPVVDAAEEAKSQIDAVYKALIAAQDLPEKEPDALIITPMYKHQKQALFFLHQKEQAVDFAKYDPKTSLWRLEPDNRTYRHVITNEKIHQSPKQFKGGILADDMGLGKTIEVISLIMTTRAEFIEAGIDPETEGHCSNDVDEGKSSLISSGATLIVCPLSTIHNWEEQIGAHVRADGLKVTVYHGPTRIQDPNELSKFDVVITTYNLLSSEYSKDMKSNSSLSNEGSLPTITSNLQRIRWFRIVLDEAHIIKDSNTAQSKAACFLSGERHLFSLIKFLRVEPFNSKNAWNFYISKPVKYSSNSIGVQRLQTLMKSITLRRTKTQVIDGKPILSLPGKEEDLRIIPLSTSEQVIYDQVHAKAKAFFVQLTESGDVMKHYVHLLEIILRMRQICVHPALFKDFELEMKTLDEQLISTTDEVFPPLTHARAIHLLSLLREAGDDKCSSCAVLVDHGVDSSKSLCIGRCGHLFCNACMSSLLESESSSQCPMCQFTFQAGDIYEMKELEQTNENEEEDAVLNIGLNLTIDNQSTKIRALVEDLVTLRQEMANKQEKPVKSVVFSQWTSVLDLCQTPLTDAGFKFCRLDGKMKRPDRALAMERFKTDPEIDILLLSLKAGGVGLNLTAASRVYIIEPYWNPAVEQQAVDRVHRMGQVRPVNVIRFIAKGTIEESILELQRRKTKLAEMAFKDRGSEGDDGADGLGKKGKRRERARENKAELAHQRMLDLRLLFK